MRRSTREREREEKHGGEREGGRGTEREEKRKAREKKRAAALKPKPRGGFLNHPRIVQVLDVIQKNKYFIIVATALKPYTDFIAARISKYSKVGGTEDEDDEEEKDGDDEEKKKFR
jgi:hypothetical protein